MPVSGAVIKLLAEAFRQLLERQRRIDAMVADQRVHHLPVKPAELHGAEDRLQSSLMDALRLIDQQLRIELLREAQSVAGRASAERRVKGKHARLQFFDTDAMIRTRQLGAEHLFIMLIIKIADHRYESVALGDRQLAGLRNTALLPRLDHDTIHNDLDRMLIRFFQFDLVLFQQLDLAVHPHARKALAANAVEDLLMRALAPAHHRRQHQKLRTFFKSHDRIHHLVDRLAADQPAADRAVRFADSGVKQAQIVVDLRHGADGRPRIAVGRFLVDGDRRGKPLDVLHVRFFHLTEELSRVGRKTLHVAPLSLRIDRIERQ